MRWVGYVECVEDIRNAYKILVTEPEEKRPLGRPRHRWEDDIRMDLKEIGWGSVDWIHLAQDRNQWQAPMNTVVNLWVPSKGENLAS
jgi:hypothetical protein